MEDDNNTASKLIEIKEILDKLEIVARKHTIEVCDDGSKIETMPASIVDELRLNNWSAKQLLDYITNLQQINNSLTTSLNKKIEEGINLQQELENKCWDEASIRADVLLEQQDYKSRCEKVDWWLREMLKQAESDETKAIINGTLDLLNGEE